MCIDLLPHRVHARQVTERVTEQMKSVAVIVQDGVEPFGLGAICEVWAEPYHPDDDNPVFDFRVTTPVPGRVRGTAGFDVHVEHGLDAAADADLICVAPHRSYAEPAPAVVDVLRAAHDRGAQLFAHCTAAFTLGAAGLLDGRHCTTHWRHLDELSERYPEAKVDGDVLYVQDGTYHRRRLGGRARRRAAPDAPAVRLPGRRHDRASDGRAAASRRRSGAVRRARRPRLRRRDAGSAAHLDHRQPLRRPQRRAPGPRVADVGAHLRPPVPRGDRHDPARVGHPAAGDGRRGAARADPQSIDWIAAEVGFGNAATLRHHFAKVRGVSPQVYRRRFACYAAASASPVPTRRPIPA